MQRRQIIIGLAVLTATLSTTVTALAFRGGPKGGWNASIASNNTKDSCMMCHGATLGNGSVQILGAPNEYALDTLYDLIIRISDPDQVGAGFQLSAEDDNGNHVGTLIIVDAVNTQPAPVEPGWVTHTAAGVDNAIAMWQALGNTADYSIQWQAPANDVGAVHFFAAGNAINNSRNTAGDFIYLTNVTAQLQQQVVCDDGIACTDDTFDGTDCVFTPNDANCPDNGIFCDGVESCNATAGCESTGNPCSQDTFCNEQLSACTKCLTDSDCNDGIACTVDACIGGNCSFTATDALCPDNGIFCDGVELCNATSGCQSSGTPCSADLFCNEMTASCGTCASDLPCDDGNPCTDNDICAAGVCAGSPIINCCISAADCADADPCTDETCTANQCVVTPSPMCISPADADEDNDGVTDDLDECADTEPGVMVDQVGCSCSQLDSDVDGVNDCEDQCPNTLMEADVDDAGCSRGQGDDDGDGVLNAVDQCPNTDSTESTNAVGCAPTQRGGENAEQMVPDASPSPEVPTAPGTPTAGSAGFSLCGTLGLLPLIALLAGLVAMRLFQAPVRRRYSPVPDNVFPSHSTVPRRPSHSEIGQLPE